MRRWLVRGIGLGIMHALIQVVVANVRAHDPGVLAITRPLAVGVVIGVALLWAALDGWQRLPVQAGTWFAAGLVAGPLAGLLGVVGQAVLVDATGVDALGTALVGGAAFTALLVAGPAVAGLALGRKLRPSFVVVGSLDQSSNQVRA